MDTLNTVDDRLGPPLLPMVGFNAHIGMRLVEWAPDYACVALEFEDHHLNSIGIAHGGILLSALDFACGMSGCYTSPPRDRGASVTLSLTTTFMRPFRGGILRAEARRTGGGKTIFFSEGTVKDENGEVVSAATGTYRHIG